MQLGLSTYSFPWHVGVAGYLPHKKMHYTELIEFAATHDIHHLQVADNMPLHTMPVKDLEQIKRLCDDNKIQIEVGTRRLTKENIDRYLDIATYFQSPFLRMVIDDSDYHPSIKEVIEVIDSVLPQLEEKNIVLAIENHDRFKAKTLEEIILSTSKKHVAICLDTANSIGAGEGIQEILPVLLPYTINLHIKDFNIERVSHKMGFTVYGTAAGKGMLNIPQLIAQCKKNARCKTATLEIWMNQEENIESMIQEEKKLVQESIHYLKKYIQ